METLLLLIASGMQLLNCVWCTVSDIGRTDKHLSLQKGWTALMKSYDRGHRECVKMLLDRGALVNTQNEVSGVIHCVHGLQQVPRVPSSE